MINLAPPQERNKSNAVQRPRTLIIIKRKQLQN